MAAFPLRLVIPEEPDPTERAMHDVFRAAADFEDAIQHAACTARIAQVRERARVMATLLLRVADQAADRHELVTKGH